MTLCAACVASSPPDVIHHNGYGKVENLSAFLEVGLLILIAIWIFYHTIRRLLCQNSHDEITILEFLVMFVTLAVDATPSRVLLWVVRLAGNQTLQADALYFSTERGSSFVVIVGLLVVWLAG
jgi:divalent metal cation (Fe/Co/Zn/Cd) transporter